MGIMAANAFATSDPRVVGVIGLAPYQYFAEREDPEVSLKLLENFHHLQIVGFPWPLIRTSIGDWLKALDSGVVYKAAWIYCSVVPVRTGINCFWSR